MVHFILRAHQTNIGWAEKVLFLSFSSVKINRLVGFSDFEWCAKVKAEQKLLNFLSALLLSSSWIQSGAIWQAIFTRWQRSTESCRGKWRFPWWCSQVESIRLRSRKRQKCIEFPILSRSQESSSGGICLASDRASSSTWSRTITNSNLLVNLSA